MTGESFAFFRWTSWVWGDHPYAHEHGWHCDICRYTWREMNS